VAAYKRGLYWFMEKDGQDEGEVRQRLEIRSRVADI